MRKIIEWMMNVEKLASETYEQAAVYFADDHELKNFLERLAGDEAWHYHIISSAMEHLDDSTQHVPLISMEKNRDTEVQQIFSDITSQIDAGTLTKEFMLKTIVELEFSEWNDVFLYILNFLKKELKEYTYAAPRIQSHRRSIQRFLENMDNGQYLLNRIRKIPEIWTEQILIVDDDESISELFQTILNSEGKIDISANGREALEKISKNYYKLIISDVNMPVMNGKEFYRKAVEKFPDINNRFLFITGDLSENLKLFFKTNNLKYLLKPASIKAIRKASLDILLNQ